MAPDSNTEFGAPPSAGAKSIIAGIRLFGLIARKIGLKRSALAILTGTRRYGTSASSNTRAVTLTVAGADYLARVETILAALAEAEHATRSTGELKGVLRVALSSSFGVREVIPVYRPFFLCDAG